jgi:signal transduction histidine kinase
MGRFEGAHWSSAAGIAASGAGEAPSSGRDPLQGIDHARPATIVQRSLEPSLRVDMRHDLRHAAATILLLVATIRDDTDDPRTITAYDGIAHCAHTIAEMMDADDEATAPGAVHLDELARMAAARASLLYSGVVECHASPATVLASDTDISRLFANLIQNSCRAAGKHGIVEVRVCERGDWCELQVGDSGAGFDGAIGPRGIGLSSITAIAVRLGGDVTFGQSPLGGALVTVNLPRLVRGDP